MGKTKKSVNDLIVQFFKKHQNKDLQHGVVVDYVFQSIPKARDPWRSIRKLHDDGFLIKVRKGVYRYDPNYKGQAADEPFPEHVKQAIFQRDNFRCFMCGNGLHNGYEIHADHKRPRNKGGQSTLENGQTLCSEHNILKKNYGTAEFLDKYYEKMLALAKKNNDTKMQALFEELLAVIQKHKEAKQ